MLQASLLLIKIPCFLLVPAVSDTPGVAFVSTVEGIPGVAFVRYLADNPGTAYTSVGAGVTTVLLSLLLFNSLLLLVFIACHAFAGTLLLLIFLHAVSLLASLF
jgi:hypothetical protein